MHPLVHDLSKLKDSEIESKILDLSKSDPFLNKDFNSLLKTKVNSDFSKKFIKENNTYAAKLAKSWINTINKAK
jgi:hypothetical protein